MTDKLPPCTHPYRQVDDDGLPSRHTGGPTAPGGDLRSYGAFALGFGISFRQALAAGVIGIVFSFLLRGFIAVVGKRGSAPTMVLGRAA